MDNITLPGEMFKIVQQGQGIGGHKISDNFSWAEVFTNRTSAEIKKASEDVFIRAAKQAERLEKIRTYLKAKLNNKAVIQVTSWYRSPSSNASSGGAKQSQHLLGNATDFIVPGYESVSGNKKVQALLCTQKDIIGFCLEITNGAWTHVDGRSANFVFENAGGGRYPLWSLNDIKAFAKAYGG